MYDLLKDITQEGSLTYTTYKKIYELIQKIDGKL